MLFGVINGPAEYMNLKNHAWMDYLDKFVIVFIYDFLIYLKSKQEQEEHLRLVLQKLKDK